MGFDCRVFVISWFRVAFCPGLDVGETDVWTEFTCFCSVDVSSYAIFPSRTTIRLEIDKILAGFLWQIYFYRLLVDRY